MKKYCRLLLVLGLIMMVGMTACEDDKDDDDDFDGTPNDPGGGQSSQMDAPKLLSPANGKTIFLPAGSEGKPFMFDWTDVDGAAGYLLFDGVNGHTTTESQIGLFRELGVTEWKVRAIGTDSQGGPYSEIFTVKLLELLIPPYPIGVAD